MRMSTRGRYGLRAMLELARRFGGPPVRMEGLAREEGVSRKYLHTLLTSLKSADLVHSIRGKGGGFVLARPPAEIRLSEIVHALEGPLSLVHCVTNTRVCARTRRCAARRVWRDLSEAIERVLANVTLGDLIAPERGGGAKARTRWRAGAGRRGVRGASSCPLPRRHRSKAGAR